MGLSLVTGPTEEPVSLAEAKAHCRIDSTDEDGLLAGYILAARVYCEGDTKRAFLTQTWDFTIDYGWPRYECDLYRIDLPLGNLQSVTSINYVDASGSHTLATDQYVVRTDNTSGVIVPPYGTVWPSLQIQMAAVTVRFVVGWLPAKFPDDLRQAMLLLIGAWYENRESVVFGRTETPAVLPMAAEAILSSYRISRFL